MKKAIYTEQNKTICEWLKSCRIAKGLTVRELAKRLNCWHSVIVRVENGERMINLVEFVEWIVALQANPREVIDKLWLIEMDEQTRSESPSWER